MPYGRFGGFDCADCETNWLIGRRGVCDEENRLCICPDGFSGKDDFVITQTCHINEQAVTAYHQLIVCVAGISLFVNLASLITLLRRPTPSKTEERNMYEVFQLTKLAIFFAILYIGFLAASSAIYGFAGGRVSFADFPIALPMIGGAGVLFLGLTYNTMFITWYKSIPDPREYGKLMDIPEFITKYPDFVPRACMAASAIWVILTIIGFFILPYTDDSKEFGQTSASFFIFSLPFGLIMYCFITILTLKSLERLYTAAFNTAKATSALSAGTEVVNNTFQKKLSIIHNLLRTIQLFKLVLGGAIGISLVLATTHILIGGIYQYIFFTGPALVITVASIFAPILTLRNTNGGMLPRSK